MPKTYHGKEKYILRKAFDFQEDPYLPDEVLWRQKNNFGWCWYNWIDELIDYCATQVTEEQLAGAAIEFPYNSPATKEAYFLGLFLISTIQTTAAQTVRNGFQNGKKIWIQVEEQIHTCRY
jgi:asparagine synthase (glutamine-hydrolysing)